MNSLKGVELFAFDLFDTTVHSTVRCKPYNKIIKASEIIDKTDLVEACMTQDMTIKELLEVFCVTDRFTEEEIQRYVDREYNRTRVMPWTEEVFEAIRTKTNAQIAIVSNLGSAYGRRIHKLPPVDHAIFSYEIGSVKPKSDIFHCLQKKVDLPSKKIVMIGNNFKNDYLGAKWVWRNAIHLDHQGVNRTDESISDLTELLPLITE